MKQEETEILELIRENDDLVITGLEQAVQDYESETNNPFVGVTEDDISTLKSLIYEIKRLRERESR